VFPSLQFLPTKILFAFLISPVCYMSLPYFVYIVTQQHATVISNYFSFIQGLWCAWMLQQHA
jgi:hypothetical protein